MLKRGFGLKLIFSICITFYDASYLMASIVFKKPLVTVGGKHKRVAAKHVQVMSWRKYLVHAKVVDV